MDGKRRRIPDLSRVHHRSGRIAATLCLVVLILLAWGCSKDKSPEPIAQSKSTETPPAVAPPQDQLEMDEALPPALRTPWKGDLDEMAKRRVVRVLLPFRRPEFFYIDGRPRAILQQSFQELERV